MSMAASAHVEAWEAAGIMAVRILAWRVQPLPARLLQQRMLALLDALPAATSGDVTSVHRARVASRRLREVLPVLAEAAGSPELDAGRQGRAAHHARARTDSGTGRGARTSAGNRAADGRFRPRPRNRPASPDGRAAGPSSRDARRDHAECGGAIAGPARDLGRPRWAEQLPTIRRSFAPPASERPGARCAFAPRSSRAGGLYQPEQLHMVRVAAKKLRYALEVDCELSRSRAMARVDRIKALQDGLGEIHDFEILLEHTRAVQTGLAGTDRQTANELDALVHVLETECRDGHVVYLRDRATIEGICFRIIEAPAGAAQRSSSPMAAILDIYLVRHAIAAERGPRDADDRKRPLTPEGIKRFEEAVAGLDGVRRRARRHPHQPADPSRGDGNAAGDRAEETPPIEELEALAPGGKFAAIVEAVSKQARRHRRRIALVGHEPDLGETAARLARCAGTGGFPEGCGLRPGGGQRHSGGTRHPPLAVAAPGAAAARSVTTPRINSATA